MRATCGAQTRSCLIKLFVMGRICAPTGWPSAPRGSARAKRLGTVGRDHGVRASTGLGFAPSAARS
jgi:hypothetical protein